MEGLKKKAKQLEATAAVCKVNADEVLEDIAVSSEIANKITESLHYQDATKGLYPQWWATFLEEWNRRCFRRCLANVEAHSLKTMREWTLWFGSFEALWMGVI